MATAVIMSRRWHYDHMHHNTYHYRQHCLQAGLQVFTHACVGIPAQVRLCRHSCINSLHRNAITATAADADMEICVTLGASDVIGKGGFTLTLATDALTGALGSVVYDTTSEETPYRTTSDGYNQGIFLDNRGTTAAYYSSSFTTESGVTATGGASSTGTLAAGEIAVVRVGDLVTFDGGTRGSASLDIEAQTSSIFVTSQIVDLGTGVTDTQSLHPADNSVGSCTNTISEGTAVVATGTPVVNALAIVNTDGDSSYASQYATNASTAHNASYAYSSCTD